jgi:hypothetical protein
MLEKRNASRLHVRKPEGKRPLGRSRRRRVDNVDMEIGEIQWCGVDWIGMAQDRDMWKALLSTVMNIRVP